MTESKELAPPPDQRVIDALNAVYRPCLTAFEQFHRQEHRFEVRYRLDVLRDRFDHLVDNAHCWRHKLLNRIERLGGDADSTMMPVRVESDVAPAFEATHALLAEIRDALKAAIDIVFQTGDHSTHKLLMHISFQVDKKMSKVEAWMRQAMEMKENYLITLVK